MTRFTRCLAPISSALLLCIVTGLYAQPQRELISVVVGASRSDWTYRLGERADFTAMVLRDGVPLEGLELRAEIGYDMMPPMRTERIVSGKSAINIRGESMNTAGFLRCRVSVTVDGREYQGMATAGFAPENILPVATMPDDFMEFWQQAIAENSRIPVDPIVTLLPERCTEKVNVYHVSIQNYRPGSRIYGILCIPRAPGKYPAVLEVPGAGIRPYSGRPDLAEAGILSLQIGIHGIPVNLSPGIYQDLMGGALNGYWTMNLDDRDQYYFKRVYLGCLRAVDFIFSLPEFDGVNIGVTGGSQGGALSIVTAGLDPRVKCLAAYYPALCDLTGYRQGRAGGWPHFFREENGWDMSNARIRTSAYYDVVNFARQVRAPGWYSWGFNDTVCPPTSMYAAYNVITAPRQLMLYPETGHWTFPEQREQSRQWLIGQLKK